MIENNVYVPLVQVRMVRDKMLPYGKESVCTADKAVKLANQIVEEADREYVMVLSLDSQSKPVAIEIVSIGSLTEAMATGREVFKHAIQSSAACIILLHNHPSGCPQPSEQDYLITQKLQHAAELLGIELVDHIIIGDEGCYYSMNENKELMIAI